MLYANGYPVGGGGGGSTEIIADDFDATATYAVGDYCIYDGKLYKCTTAVSTAGQWDSTKWTETLVMDEVGGGGGGSDTHHYSTDEQVIGTWIDGKTLYEKTFDFSSDPLVVPQSQNWVSTGISNAEIDTIIGSKSLTTAGDYSSMIAVNKFTNQYPNNICLQNNRQGVTSIYFFVLQYTKSS